MSIPSKSNSTSFAEADLASGTESPTKPGVCWFQNETPSRAMLVEVRVTNGELTVWWPTQEEPVAKSERPLSWADVGIKAGVPAHMLHWLHRRAQVANACAPL